MGKKEQSAEKGRKWIFTSQRSGIEEEKNVSTEIEKIAGKTYCKIAMERGETGNYHLQGYIEFGAPTTFGGVQKKFSDWWRNPHIEFAYSPSQAQAYVGGKEFVGENGDAKKGEIFWCIETGKSTNTGGAEKRKGADWNQSLLQMKAEIDAGATEYDLWQNHFLQMIYVGGAMQKYMDHRRAALFDAQLCPPKPIFPEAGGPLPGQGLNIVNQRRNYDNGKGKRNENAAVVGMDSGKKEGNNRKGHSGNQAENESERIEGGGEL